MSIFQKRYELPLVRGYVAHWGVTEGVRELLQNALDSESPFRCTYMGDVLRIISEDSVLPTRSLLLGATAKANDENTIGSFGEGYKIAMLVLARLDKQMVVYNDKVTWTPEFRMSNTFGEETLHVAESKREGEWEDRLVFEISGITQDEYDEIKKTCVHLWSREEIGEVLETQYGQIMTQHQGKLYVNGLFICDMDLDYSYNVKPSFITLERDRQTVSSWNAKLLCKNMWFDTGLYDRVAEMIEGDCPDMEHADFMAPDLIKEACYRLFVKKNPNHIAVKTQEELDKYVANGMTNVVFVNNTMHSMLGSTPAYARSKTVLVVRTPTEVVETWLRENRRYMRKEAIVNFKELSTKAASWKNK